eukprot:1631306-Pyramimonas_sp.AAC.1
MRTRRSVIYASAQAMQAAALFTTPLHNLEGHHATPPFSLDLVEKLRLFCELPNPEELQNIPQGHIIQISVVLDVPRAWQGFCWAFGAIFIAIGYVRYTTIN